MAKAANKKVKPQQSKGGVAAFVFGIAVMVGFSKGMLALSEMEFRPAAFLVVFPSILVTGPLAVAFVISFFVPRFRALACGLLVGGLLFWGGWNIPWRKLIPKRDTGHLSLASWNVYMGALGPDGVLDQIKKEKADVWCFQEIIKWKRNPGLNLDRTKEIVGGEKVVVQGGETALVSSLPVLERKVVPLGGSSRRIVGIKVHTQQEDLWVVCAHYLFSSVGVRKMTSRVGRMMSSDIHFIQPMKSQTQYIQHFLSGLDGPAVLMGDFNSTPLMPPYASLRQTHMDAFLAAGWGFGYSFHRKTPLIRIDYIWAPKKTHRVVSFRRIWSQYSDHALIRAEISPR